MASFAKRYGLDESTALTSGRCFGSGMGLGLTCGAVTGAFMVLAFSRGEVTGDDREGRYATYDLVKEFKRRFELRCGAIECKALLGLDLGTAEGRREAKERGLFHTVCPEFVRHAAQILEEMLP